MTLTERTGCLSSLLSHYNLSISDWTTAKIILEGAYTDGIADGYIKAKKEDTELLDKLSASLKEIRNAL